NLPTDTLVDTFCFLSRWQLDVLCLLSRRLCHVISLKMETLCLRSLVHFHLTYEESERRYKLKAIPTDGKHFYFRSRVDEVFCMVPKLLRSTYVKRLAFGHVVLSDSLCKSIRDVAHTMRIDELELGCSYANGFVDENLSRH
ncbi:hypothetical protein AAVH_35181, partial [Aphelenchoides avenae]